MLRATLLIFFVVIIVSMMIVFGNWATPVQANNIEVGIPTPTVTPIITVTDIPGEVASSEQQEEIKSIIQEYFEARYHALSVSDSRSFQQNGFGNLVSEEGDAKVFLSEEMGKLAVEIKRAELNHLRYIDYKYFLDFRNIIFDPNTQTATVFVVEDNEVVYEISNKLNSQEPIVSHMYDREHTITLHKKENQWKIISDNYNDYLWRMLRQRGLSSEDMLRTIETLPIVQIRNIESAPANAVPIDVSSHPYDRNGAIDYAINHAGNPNPNYYNYQHIGGDCTNFISQAIYEGGNASMSIPTTLPPPSTGGDTNWYYLDYLRRARAWTEVDSFYEFVTTGGWEEGPQGTLLLELDEYEVPETMPVGLMLGDVIQFEWGPAEDGNGDQFWDHAVIIVGFASDGTPLVASRTENYAFEPYMTFSPWQKIRFIHIEQSDGYTPVKAEVTSGVQDAGQNVGTCINSNTDGNIYLGKCANGNDITSGFQFKEVPIPSGATIKYAYIIFTTDGPYDVNGAPGIKAPISLNIFGDYSGLDFASTFPSTRNNLTPSVLWDITGVTNGAEYDSWNYQGKRATPNLGSIVQSLIGGSWNYGNPLTFIFQNNNGAGIMDGLKARRVIGFERASGWSGFWSARLVAAYSFGGGTGSNPPVVYSVTRADPNPTNAATVNFRVQFSEAVTGVDSSDFTLPLTDVPVAGTYITGVTPDPLDASLYTVQVNTGTGDGIIKLDVKNSATGIFDINENLPLNGGFSTGESYTIDKTAPTVISFSLASPNPTNAAEVNFIFTFDEIVTGVDPNDFELLASGVSGASISSVTVLNSKSHIISVNTGSGNGIISLVLRPSPASSIADLASNLLNVPIPGYFTYPPYTIDKVAPTTSSSSLASSNPTSSSNVEFTVTFPEPVSGVDVNDFALTTTGVFGAAISGISGSGNVYTISVDTGNGNGTIRLDISVDASISDLTGNQLSGLPYTNGETYTVTKTTDAPWNTFLGGDGNDRSYAMIGDGWGNFYVTGISSSSWGNPIQPYSGGDDVFLAKVDASGNLVWHTFIGGLFPENYGQELAIDDNGDVYVAGRGDSSWGNPVRPYSDLGDGFVTKINSSGQVLWTTFLGGAASFDAAKGIEVKNGSVFVTGHSSANWGSPLNAYTGGIDGFLASLDAGTGNLNWNTFLGGAGEDYLFTVHVDNSENIFLGGYSTETWGAPVIAHTPGTNNDGFVTKFNAAGVLMWNTFMGSSEGSDMVYGMDESAAGDIYLAGRSPASWGDPLNVHAGGGIDAFIAKMDPATGVLAWHRFVGGNGSDFSWGIDVDDNDNIHIVGGSDASWGSPARAHAGGYEAFYARLNASGELLGNSFAGGGGADRGYGLVVGTSNDIYLSGYSDATWDTPIRAYTNGNDAFLVRLDMTGMPVVVSSVTRTSASPTNASSVNFNVTFSEAVTGVDAGDFTLTTSGVTGASVTGVSGAGNTYTVTVNTGSGSGSIRLDVVDDDSITNASSAPLSGGFSTGQAFLVDNLAPTVLSSMRGPINPDTSGLNFTVTFSEPVTGVDVTDFGLTTTGVTGTSIVNVTGAGNSYVVNVNAGSGSGTVRLNIVDDDTILDAVSNPLGGAGAGNGNYIAGETYSVTSVTLNSIGTQDGHILESSENSGVGGTVNSTATSFYVGDNNADRQYLSVMHFDTSALPDTAVIASATLRVRQQGSFTGTNPFTTHGNLVAAVQNPYFGASNSLLAEDFQAASGLAGIATFSSTPVSSWFSAPLNPEGFLYVNLAGATQFRVGFTLDDNDDNGADYVAFSSGNNGTTANRPQVVIQYYLP